MKKILLLVGVVGVVMATTSCKKEYDCDCTLLTTLNGSVTGSYEVTSQITATKAEARKVCKDLGKNLPTDPNMPEVDMQCKLKN